jgi:drug/metabolite transporter (DMT)-like permease
MWLGMLVGLLGAGGQLAVFRALQSGPAYLVFPILSLSPVVTVALSTWLLRERTHRLAALGVALSVPAFPLLAAQPVDPQQPAGGYAWLAGALAALLMWGAQAYLIKASSGALSAESLFAYMAVAAVVLAPVAWSMTDTATPINWGLSGPYATALIQSLNSVGALLSIYALRAGKALVVAPTINGLFPGITVALSLVIYARIPERWNAVGMVLALIAVALMSYGEQLTGEASALKPPPTPSPVPQDRGAERAAGV